MSQRRKPYRRWVPNPQGVRCVSSVTTVTVLLFLGVVSGCGGTEARSVFYGTYVGQLCESIGPFERDSQSLGKALGRYSLALKSRRSEQEVAKILAARIADTRHILGTLRASGAPSIPNGRALARRAVVTFREIKRSDVAWVSELRTGTWVWPLPSTSQVKRKRVRISLHALVSAGQQISRLPSTRESRNAMARSPVCRELFGSVRVGAAEQ